ncbi:MAG: ABC transporter ATP-binding protein [Mycobacteriales bacterium]
MLLEVDDLSVSYRTGHDVVRAVRGISFAIDAGETLAMAGESGSGKSTVALSLLRLLPPSAQVSGAIRFRGDDLLTANWAALRAVRWADASIVFQGAMSALNPVRSIGEQIREPILLHSKVGERTARERTAALLDSVGVSSRRARSYPHELSGGQRQRVMIAMALACDPDLIIADEPTTALDVIVQAQILTLLADLVRDSHIGMIFISHDLSVLAQACDRLAVMYAGRIVEIGPSRALIDRPRHPYTRALGAAFPRIGDPASRLAPTGLAGDPPDLRAELPGCAFAPRCPVSMAACRDHEIALWPAGAPPGEAALDGDPASRRSACLRVLPEFAGVPAQSQPGEPSELADLAEEPRADDVRTTR